MLICTAIAEVYNNEGDSEYERGDFYSAIESYTQGIKTSCKDDKLNAILFTNRATSLLNWVRTYTVRSFIRTGFRFFHLFGLLVCRSVYPFSAKASLRHMEPTFFVSLFCFVCY